LLGNWYTSSGAADSARLGCRVGLVVFGGTGRGLGDPGAAAVIPPNELDPFLCPLSLCGEDGT